MGYTTSSPELFKPIDMHLSIGLHMQFKKFQPLILNREQEVIGAVNFQNVFWDELLFNLYNSGKNI